MCSSDLFPSHDTGTHIDRNFNPFKDQIPSKINDTAMVNLTEMYQQETSALPSKINLFDEEDEDLEEDLLRLPNGYWLFNKDHRTLMLDLGRIHQIVLAENRKNVSKSKKSQSLLFSLEYHLNEIEKNKFRSIKKYLPDLGFDIVLAQDNVLRINAVPEDVKESQVIKFLENLLRFFHIFGYCIYSQHIILRKVITLQEFIS